MRVLVTGAAGLIGSAIVRVNTSHEIIPVTRQNVDLLDFKATLDFLSANPADALIHAAALVGGIGGNSLRSAQYFHDNILMNTNVLEAARLTGIDNLVTYMSTCIFPADANYPLTVDQLHQGEPHPSNFGYAFAKRMLDVQVRAYNLQWDTNYKILIPTNVYGPNDNFSLLEGHVLPALIHKLFLASQSDDEFVVWGSGKPLREFVYSDDIARVSLLALERQLSAPVIVTSEVETSIKEVSLLLARILGFDREIIFDAAKPDGQFRKPSSAEDMRIHFPNIEFTELEEGLRKTVDWFAARFPEVRM